MALLYRREAEGAVLDGVVLGADTEEPAVEEAHSAGEDALARQPALGEVLRGLPAQAGQGAREPQHLVELLLVAPLPPERVVEVLAPPGGIGPDRLDVPVRVRADPHVSPGGRNDELADPLEDLFVVDPLALFVQKLEATAAAPADDPRAGAVDAAKSRHRRAVFPAQPAAETG